MSLAANIRVNLSAPFPAMVQGGSGITVTKQNGIWTIGLSSGQLLGIMQAAGYVPVTAGSGQINFGAFPGSTDAQLVITGQANILAGSIVEAFIMPAATADHTVDEHWLDPPRIQAGNIVPGVGFTIYGVNTWASGGLDPVNPMLGPGSDSGFSGVPLVHGAWSVGWRWQ